MEKTKNLGLLKPERSDFFSVAHQNDNLDKIDEEIGNKVDKVVGKGLSANDFTDEEKQKVAQIGDVGNRANNAYSRADSAYSQANAAYNRANTAYSQANSAYNIANNAIAKLNANAVAVGANALAVNTNSSYSTAVGYSANANGVYSVALGHTARAINSYSTALGYITRASGSYSTAVGADALANGSNSVALGYLATAFGAYSVAIGYYANASGSHSMALGSATIASGNNSTALGYLAQTNGSDSIALGHNARTSGFSSVALGSNTFAIANSTALGYKAQAETSYATALGYNSIASGYGSTALGYSANVASSSANTIQLGASGTLSALKSRVALTVTSDERDKTDITEIGSGAVEFLKKVRAIRYVFNHRELYINEENLSEEERKKKRMYGLCAYDKEAHAKGTKKGSRIRVGVSAQGTQKALQEVYGSSNYANLVDDNLFDIDQDEIPEGVESQLSANYEGFIPFLIKAVQELAERLEAVEKSKKGAITV